MCKVCQRQAKGRRKILQMMSRGLVTAADIAGELSVSIRTVYRYVDELRDQGQPIVGEAGVGYMLRRQPPSMEGRHHG